jgi:rubrerythrin
MEIKSPTDILKEAILLEHRGRAFYSEVAARTDSEAVKRIFTIIADEEQEHIRFCQNSSSTTRSTIHSGGRSSAWSFL